MVNIRQIGIHDVIALSIFVNQLHSESQYLIFDPGEWQGSIQKIKSYILRIKNTSPSIILIAEANPGEIVGYICGEVTYLKRFSHVMKVNVGILKAYRGQGVGERLSEQLYVYAKQVGIVRVEVTVIKENEPSLRLCKKFGLRLEGVKKCSVQMDGKLHDEYIFSRILSSDFSSEKAIN